MNRLRDVLAGWPGAHIVENSPEYLSVQFETRWLRFVDDAEFLLDPDRAGYPRALGVAAWPQGLWSQSQANRSDSPTSRPAIAARAPVSVTQCVRCAQTPAACDASLPAHTHMPT